MKLLYLIAKIVKSQTLQPSFFSILELLEDRAADFSPKLMEISD